MIRYLAAALALMLVSGCEHYFDLKSKDFLPGATPPQKFAQDSTGCTDKAVQLQAQSGGNGDPHGIYNRAYKSCMETAGYRPVNPTRFDGW